ncbi:MAG: 3-hydroxyacyl-CoA dehydrogenase [Sulfobacillus benefaciens]|uniref:3-hydroxyacyl-CoA dehydrogenase n=1 Tax=Sulfobacillus benefaciens TaxID=453960 RepID=A0A2T2X841_9FIRM|nr:MAG: 3-hydroxyacyl-CoA dehydrogenase [Sulfobacillus benefaciens]
MEHRVAVIGAGLIGRAWSIVFARSGYEVRLYDSAKQVRDAVMLRLEATLADLEAMALIPVHEKTVILSRVSIVDALADAVVGVPYVQEAIQETLEAKQSIFGQIERLAESATILASSSSALLPSQIFSHMQHKGRCVVVHPVNPPFLVPFVEIVPDENTASTTVQVVKDLMARIKQQPIVLKREYPGFVLNRLQVALVNEAISIVQQGIASVADVDDAVKFGLGRRWAFMGPFETIDLNAPGGIRDFLERFESMYLLAKEFHAMAPFSPELLAQLEMARRNALPLSQLENRMEWRDQELMRVTKLFLDDPPPQEAPSRRRSSKA